MEKGGPEAREGVIRELFRFHRVVSTCQGNNLKCRACLSWVWWNDLLCIEIGTCASCADAACAGASCTCVGTGSGSSSGAGACTDAG